MNIIFHITKQIPNDVKPNLSIATLKSKNDYIEKILKLSKIDSTKIILDFLPPFPKTISATEIFQFIVHNNLFDEIIVFVENEFTENYLKSHIYSDEPLSYKFEISPINSSCFQKFTIELATGNIVNEQGIDELVNPTSISLKLGGGVSGKLGKAVGPRLKEEMQKIRETDFKFNAGDTFYTSAFNLPFKGIIHVITKPSNFESIIKGVENILDLCNKKDYKSVCIPMIGTGNAKSINLQEFYKAFETGTIAHFIGMNKLSTVEKIKIVHPSKYSINELRNMFVNAPNFGEKFEIKEIK